MTGEYDAGQQVLVSGKQQDGADGYWVLTGSARAVGCAGPGGPGVRAGVGGVRPVGRPHAADRSGRGVRCAASRPTRRRPTGTPRRARRARSPPPTPPTLVNLWGNPIYNVLVYADAASAASAGCDPRGRAGAAGRTRAGSLDLRNAAYAVQWWLFGVVRAPALVEDGQTGLDRPPDRNRRRAAGCRAGRSAPDPHAKELSTP